ncbi:hypothetical protein TW78_00885 [Vibrio coralliilyticus]|uniref:Uncharacterized protein n=1 Tax=Vibrio coralliilyticus TaxID=190893 RepID=A0A837G308_9VIBR|nr:MULTISPECIES: hypothetical protein [Vibrio]KJY79289.1 hypothetical protein TW78_00885 [Vibrio coralliilyticus]MCG9786817.1 hypothetical protein [Vibrio mediterranei]MDF9390670.1 hypothetical protein [Vibrio sp. 1151_11]QOU30794.1 hypothetical protein TW71_004585 [Vibrio coralliilyticus]
MEATQHRVEDPLSEVTRKVRRNLIATVAVIFLMIYGNLMPTKVDSLGISFTDKDHAVLFTVLFLTLAYWLSSFVIYSSSDFLKWKIALTNIVIKEEEKEVEQYIKRKYGSAHLSEKAERGETTPLDYGDETLMDHKNTLKEELRKRTRLYNGPVYLVSMIRALIDFIAPILLGGAALWHLYPLSF